METFDLTYDKIQLRTSVHAAVVCDSHGLFCMCAEAAAVQVNALKQVSRCDPLLQEDQIVPMLTYHKHLGKQVW